MAAVQNCVVCGRASTRAAWNNINVYGTTYVACDFHSQNVIRQAVTTIAGGNPVPTLINKPKSHHESENA